MLLKTDITIHLLHDCDVETMKVARKVEARDHARNRQPVAFDWCFADGQVAVNRVFTNTVFVLLGVGDDREFQDHRLIDVADTNDGATHEAQQMREKVGRTFSGTIDNAEMPAAYKLQLRGGLFKKVFHQPHNHAVPHLCCSDFRNGEQGDAVCHRGWRASVLHVFDDDGVFGTHDTVIGGVWGWPGQSAENCPEFAAEFGELHVICHNDIL